MKVYLTKYALTEGIKVVEVEKDGNFYSERINSYSCLNYLEHDVSLTLEEARYKANNMRIDKLYELGVEVARLEKLNFFE